MTLDERAAKLQALLAEDKIPATHQECRDLIIADFIEQVLARTPALQTS
jgi:hypothetical protein